MFTSRRLPLALLVACLALLMAASPVAAGMAVCVRHGDRTEKVIALTFDDGWSAKRAQQIVAILDKHGVTATFFPYANAVKGAPDPWRSIARRHPIANHTISHPKLTRLSSAAIYKEIDGARRIIERITGRPMVRLFRPPYGSWDSRVAKQAYKAGFKYLVMWDVDSGDTHKNRTTSRVYRLATSGRKGSIVLMHAGPAVTPQVLDDVIRNYKSRGFGFVTLCQMLDVEWK